MDLTNDEIIHLMAEILSEALMPIPPTCPWCHADLEFCSCKEESPVGS